jgi:surface polysaccharide O-acyltransferase-like enzyme
MAVETVLYPFLRDIVLPFILVFVLLYALMEKIKLLENKQAHLLIALAIAFFFIGVPALLNLTSVIIPVLAILVIVAFCVMLLFGILGIEFYAKEGGGKFKYALAGILLIVGIVVVASAAGLLQKITSWLTPQLIQFIAFFIIIVIAIALVVGFKTEKK